MSQYYRIIDHTADLAVRASGSTREELFLAVLKGVITLLIGKSQTRNCRKDSKTHTLYLSSQGEDDEERLVELVNRFLFACQTEGWFPLEAQSVSFADDRTVNAVIAALPRSPKYKLIREIKAATYHNLKIESGIKWRTTLVMDV